MDMSSGTEEKLLNLNSVLVKYLVLLSLKYQTFQHKIVPLPPPPAFCPIFEILNYWMCIDKKRVRLPMTNVKQKKGACVVVKVLLLEKSPNLPGLHTQTDTYRDEAPLNHMRGAHTGGLKVGGPQPAL
jgi:hypothetical protein